MANLIITVIAIALVAIASLMGAYYGGSAFLNNQSAANASTVLNQAQQISGAWNAYLSDNLNSPPNDINLLVTRGYLAQVPVTPTGANVTNAALQALPMYIGTLNGRYYAYADMGSPTNNNAIVTDSAFAACKRIIKTATGADPTTVTPTTAGQISSKASGYGNDTFGCAQLTGGVTPLNGGQPGFMPDGDYVMEYLLQ